MGNERRKDTFRQFIGGWVNYFHLSNMQKMFTKVNEWYR
ncbi:group II intron maturase-specific domain-containing protein [Algoriphagus terrigena]